MSRSRRRGRYDRPRRERRTETLPQHDGLGEITPIPVSQLLFGTIVWTNVSYKRGDGDKTRPVVVVSANRHDVEVMPITSGGGAKGMEIVDWETAGLNRPSRIMARIQIVERRQIYHVTGHLSEEDLQRARHLEERIRSHSDHQEPQP